MKSKGSQKAVWIIALIIIVIILIVIFSRKSTSSTPVPSGMKLYKNVKYSFEVAIPTSWNVSENETLHAISIYKDTPSFDIHGTSTAVIFFPQGLETEAPFGTTTSADIVVAGLQEKTADYLLKSGDRWARLIPLVNGPSSGNWVNYAYAWEGLSVKDLKISCGLKTTQNCDEAAQLAHPTNVVRAGSIDANDLTLEDQVINSLKFTK